MNVLLLSKLRVTCFSVHRILIIDCLAEQVEKIHNKPKQDIEAGPALFRLHPQKELLIFTFLAYQAFKSRDGIISRKNSCGLIKDLGILG